jgi:hypothetical protein
VGRSAYRKRLLVEQDLERVRHGEDVVLEIKAPGSAGHVVAPAGLAGKVARSPSRPRVSWALKVGLPSWPIDLVMRPAAS